MQENKLENKWRLRNGVLGFENSNGFVVPSAEALYSAIHESNYTDDISRDDVMLLTTQYTFSKYPIELKVNLQTGKQGDLEANICAVPGRQKTVTISSDSPADHVMIDNTWYPFLPGALEEIQQIFKSVGLPGPSPIGLGQYLSLIKKDESLIQNQVVSITSQFLQKEMTGTPSGSKAQLYPYQEKGWQWLRFMKREGVGGILADEMGLGKTLQIIALLASEPQDDVFQSLIVCPTTLLENWRRELFKFSPQISSHIHQGSQRTGFPNDLKKYDVIITSYDTVIRDVSLFKQIKWKLVICDEAQAIKNPSTRRAIAVKQLPRTAGFAVTGTPIENSLTDLWSIMDFAVPDFLGSLTDFQNLYTSSDEGPARLEQVISPLILRRLVSEVARDLPAKIIIPQVLELSSSEADSYERIRDETLKEFDSNASLVVLTRLRMFCTHPFLVDDGRGDPAEASNKYSRMIELADEIISNGAKMLVFTSYNRMNDMIVEDLARRFGIYTNSIDGRTVAEDRQKIVDEFSNIKGAAALVLNPIAAGAGLNITAANHVIHYNLEWNPAKEDQASARAYRRGQDRPVTIHRLFYANTVEEVIDDRLTRKRDLAGTAIVGVQGNEDDYDDILNALHKSPKS